MASTARRRPGAPSHRAQGARKKLPRFMPRNPLKSLDSDERIQGNPRQSNPHNRGYLQRNGRGPRKPKRIDRTDLAGAPPRQRQSDFSPNAKWPERSRVADREGLAGVRVLAGGRPLPLSPGARLGADQFADPVQPAR